MHGYQLRCTSAREVIYVSAGGVIPAPFQYHIVHSSRPLITGTVVSVPSDCTFDMTIIECKRDRRRAYA